jgi:putative transposase
VRAQRPERPRGGKKELRAAGLRALQERGLLRRSDHAAVAAALGRSVRTIQADLAVRPAGPCRRPGRPCHERRRWLLALRVVGRVLRRQKWKAGWREVWEVQSAELTSWEVQQCTRRWKARHRRRVAAKRRACRESMEVLAPDVVWAIDAKHLSRDEQGVLSAEVVRDACPRKVRGAAVGPPASAREVVALLEAVVVERGCAPLVLMHDNGKTYVGAEVTAWRAAHGVLDLCNLPHTPQHNGAIERTMRELGEQTGLGRGVRDVGLLDAALAVRDAIRRMNSRPRGVLGRRSADEVDGPGRWIYSAEGRKELADEVRAAQQEAMRDAKSARARRLACRRALLEVLERRGLVRITRGGSHNHARRSAGVS